MSVTEKTQAIQSKHNNKQSNKLANIGFHVGRGTDMISRIEGYRAAGFNTFQIFANSPRKMLATPGKKAYDTFNEFAKYIKNNAVNVYIHSPYTINLSSPYQRTAYWNTALIQELEIAELLGARGVVVHTGRHKEQDRAVGIDNMVANLSYAVQIAKSTVPLLIETPAGQGTELGVELEELAIIWHKIPKVIKHRIGICVDTCHIFAAGYDLRTPSTVQAWLSKFDKLIGLTHLKFVHLNDSRMPLASHLDRHAQLTKGEIGTALGILTGELYRLKVPIIVETPGDFETDLAALNKWIM